MAEKPYQFQVNLSSKYSSEVKEAIAAEIISFVRQRTLSGKDVDGGSFPSYSKEYVDSVDFKAAGKSKGKINLKLSGDMLAALEVVDVGSKELILGYKDDNDQAGKAEGNQIGSYGRSPNASKARRFLGITPKDLEDILAKYPLEDEDKSEERAQAVKEAQAKIDEFANAIQEAESDDEFTLTELKKKFKLKVGR